jgi:hypothetical protein
MPMEAVAPAKAPEFGQALNANPEFSAKISSASEAFSPTLFREMLSRSIAFRASDPQEDRLRQKKTIITPTSLGGNGD